MVPLLCGDRFIPSRRLLERNTFNMSFASKLKREDVLVSDINLNYWRQNNFVNNINKCFNIKKGRLLQFSERFSNKGSTVDTEKNVYRNKRIYNDCNDYDWPCKPRSKPAAFPDTTHELPGFNAFVDQTLIDWSANGQIVASFGHDIIIWKRNEDITMSFKIKSPRSVAYSPNGKYLAIGCKACNYPVLELWDVSTLNDFVIFNGKVFKKKYSDVTSIEWIKTGNQIVCGTHFGVIFVLSVPVLKTIRKIIKHESPVKMIKISPTMRYLASGDQEGNIVIYNWDVCDVYLHVRSLTKLNVVFDWHPWNGVDLAISENSPASIVILNVPTKEIVAFYQRKDTKVSINSITFSKITGELLVSLAKNDADGNVDFKILVLSSLDRIVDMMRIPESGVRFMMWNHDGTKLATTGNDETLTIWNFCPGEARSRSKISYQVQGKQKLLADSNFGSHFKICSCLR